MYWFVSLILNVQILWDGWSILYIFCEKEDFFPLFPLCFQLLHNPKFQNARVQLTQSVIPKFQIYNIPQIDLNYGSKED